MQGILVAPTSLVMTASPLDCTLCRQVANSHVIKSPPGLFRRTVALII